MVARSLSKEGADLKRLLKLYFVVAAVYGAWALVLLQFRECGPFGLNCTPFVTQAITAVIAAGRGVLWLPNLLVAIGQGNFVDSWVLLRDVPPITLFLNSN
jgi:hypothetical protein